MRWLRISARSLCTAARLHVATFGRTFAPLRPWAPHGSVTTAQFLSAPQAFSRFRGPGGKLSRLLNLAFLVLVAGCDDDSPQGPGSFTVSVEWDAGAPPAGAAVVFLSGSGLGEISPEGGALLWTHTPQEEEGSVRVVIVDKGTPSSLNFTVPVSEVRSGSPAATLLELAGQDNAPLPVSSSYRVRVF